MAASSPPNTALDTVLLKVASRCNINCTYCYVYNMGDDNWVRQAKFMTAETQDAVCGALAELQASQTTGFSVVLHGGEPLLLGAARLRQLFAQLRAALPTSYPISLQTNGILISREILDVCARYQVSIAVSLDGPASVHDKSRLTHGGAGTFAQVMAGYDCLRTHPEAAFLNAGLLAVIDPTSDPAEVYAFFKTVGAPSVDFLYRDGNHSHLPPGKSAPNSIEYGDWMVGLLAAYLRDPDPLPVRVLDDMLKVLLGGHVSKEGLGMTDFGILIVDTDGTLMKNDTLKSTYKGADQFATAHNILTTNLGEFLGSAEFQRYRQQQRPTSSKCQKCPELAVCGGGMVLHRWNESTRFANPSVYCADQLHLIGAMRQALAAYDLDYADPARV